MSVKRATNEGFGIAKHAFTLVFQRTSTPFGQFLNAQKRRFFGKMRVFAKLCIALFILWWYNASKAVAL